MIIRVNAHLKFIFSEHRRHRLMVYKSHLTLKNALHHLPRRNWRSHSTSISCSRCAKSAPASRAFALLRAREIRNLLTPSCSVSGGLPPADKPAEIGDGSSPK